MARSSLELANGAANIVTNHIPFENSKCFDGFSSYVLAYFAISVYVASEPNLDVAYGFHGLGPCSQQLALRKECLKVPELR